MGMGLLRERFRVVERPASAGGVYYMIQARFELFGLPVCGWYDASQAYQDLDRAMAAKDFFVGGAKIQKVIG
jgi:hypothetical protein